MAITRTMTVGTKKRTSKKSTLTSKEKAELAKARVDQTKKDFVNELITLAQEGKELPWHRENIPRPPRSLSKIANLPKDHAPKDELYLGSNRLCLTVVSMIKGYKDSRWGSYKAIQDLGGHVRKGEKGIPIWYVGEKRYPETTKDPVTKEWVPVMEIDPETGEKRQKVFIKKYSGVRKVFNVEQTEGLNLEKEKPLMDVKDLAKTSETMETILKHSEAKIYYDQTSTGMSFYMPGNDTIHLPDRESFESLTAFYGTAAHEIGHSTGHPKRLNREGIANISKHDDMTYAKEELVAELSAVFLKQDLGLPIPPKEMKNHEAYLVSWDKELKFMKDKPLEFMKVIDDAEKASEYIQSHMLERTKDKEKTAALEKEDTKTAVKEKSKPKGVHRPRTGKVMGR